MVTVQGHLAFMRTCREFVTASTSMARDAVGRTRRAVSVSRERMVLSEEMIRRSETLLARYEQRVINTESDQSRR